MPPRRTGGDAGLDTRGPGDAQLAATTPPALWHALASWPGRRAPPARVLRVGPRAAQWTSVMDLRDGHMWGTVQQ